MSRRVLNFQALFQIPYDKNMRLWTKTI